MMAARTPTCELLDEIKDATLSILEREDVFETCQQDVGSSRL